MKNYFHILGLEPGASDDQIRRAFRAKAKEFHPDISKDENSRHKFIEVQQAYSFLINAAQRRNYEVLLSEHKMSRNEQDRREQIYKLWVEHQQRKARTRNAMEAVQYDANGNPTEKRIWRGLNLFYNLAAMVVFLMILILPIYNYIEQLDKPAGMQRPFIFFLVPSVLGATFLGFGYYYWFVLRTDRE